MPQLITSGMRLQVVSLLGFRTIWAGEAVTRDKCGSAPQGSSKAPALEREREREGSAPLNLCKVYTSTGPWQRWLVSIAGPRGLNPLSVCLR